jgi:2-succinyl-5-enolpyruvyl-6-hydroxy-3-cyclohexene-1-carboxylate synthase
VNPSTALAEVVVDELVRQGVREVVLCPGSRSAPLAYAVQAAERAGRVRLHVRVDERSAGFLALGLARWSGVPAVVVTTSGTAVANLHPAVLEADHGAVPLVVLSADRPPELRGTGANQTTTQPGIFAGAVRWTHDLGAPDTRVGHVPGWRATAVRAVAAARGLLGGVAGPVHLNVPLREPLVPTTQEEWTEPLAGRADEQPWVRLPGTGIGRGAEPVPDVAEDRTLLVLGDLPRPDMAGQAVAWARGRGWPVVAEPFGAYRRSEVVPHGSLLLTSMDWLARQEPRRVVTAGRVTLSRAMAALLRRPSVTVEVITATPSWADPTGLASAVYPWSVLDAGTDARSGHSISDDGEAWREAWESAGAAVARAVEAQGLPWPSGLAVAAEMTRALPPGAVLFAGSSNAARDLDLGAGTWPEDMVVIGNRGLSGIDGCVSTAAGIALAADRPAYALLGDLGLLHDANGLLVGPHEPTPDLTVVVVNDDGGGIFTLLEPGEPDLARDFERLFGTPTGTDLASLCRAHGVAHRRATRPDELATLVAARPRGITVVEVAVDRAGHRAAHARLRALAAEALAELR